MARVSPSFTGKFKLSFKANKAKEATPQTSEPTQSKSKPKSTKSETTSTDSESESATQSSSLHSLAGKAKMAISTPMHGVRRLASHYKQHFNYLLSTNFSSDYFDLLNDGEAGSTSYGDEMATEEELKRQIKRNHIDYVFYLGHNDSITNFAVTPITWYHDDTFTTFPSIEEFETFLDSLDDDDDESLDISICSDAATIWKDAYIEEHDKDIFERIERDTLSHMETIYRC